jgi:hypothetical protein
MDRNVNAQSHPLSKADYVALAAHYTELRRFQCFSQAVARQSGLAPQLCELLLAVKGSPEKEGATVAELVPRLQWSYRVTLNWLGRAERARLLRRERSGGRAPTMYSLTERGCDQLAALAPLHHRQLAEVQQQSRERRPLARPRQAASARGDMPWWAQPVGAYALVALLASLTCALALAYFAPVLAAARFDAMSDVTKLILLGIISALLSWGLPALRRRLAFGFFPPGGDAAPSSMPARYGLVLLLMPVGVLMAAAFDQMFPGPDFPWVLLFVIAVSAWYGGQGAGSLATVLALLATLYFFLPPMFELALSWQSGPPEVVAATAMMAFAGFIVVAGELRTRQQLPRQ